MSSDEQGGTLWATPRPPSFEAAPPPPAEPPSAPAGLAPDGAPPLMVWWSPFVALVAAYAAALVAFSIVAGVVGNSDSPGVVIGATYAQDICLLAAAFAFARMGGSPGGPLALGWRRVTIRDGLKWAVVAFVAFYVATAIYAAVFQVTQEDDLASTLGAKDNVASLVAVAVLVCVAAPIVEETFFRGLLFGALWRWRGWVFGAVVSGIVFGLVHSGGTSAIFLAPLAILGFLLALLYYKTGSLLPGMGVHAFNNALALGVTLHWEAWQVLIAVVAAPVLVVAIASRLSLPRSVGVAA